MCGVISDGWAAHCGTQIERIQGGVYSHQVVNVIHKDNFVDPENPEVHTNNVENMWMRAKRKFKRMFGTSHALFETYLFEFMWKQKHKDVDLFSSLIICIRGQYPV
jgi:hypothetical protein